MYDHKVIVERVKQFINKLGATVYNAGSNLDVTYIVNNQAIAYQSAVSAQFAPITVGQTWAKPWQSGWFKISGQVPADATANTGILFDTGSEACVFKNGTPWLGLTSKTDEMVFSPKRFIPVNQQAGKQVELLIEAAANKLFGAGQQDYILQTCCWATLNPNRYKLWLDMLTLQSLATALPNGSPRRRKIEHGLNKAINVWSNEEGIDNSLAVCANLLAATAPEQEITAYSVGHAHLDLAWLWPICETRRKGGRTFATALQMIEKYPGYVFGASQPQLYQWIKEDYPELFTKVQQAVKAGSWECQGAMWVEPDMNIPGGESLVRQCLYGKQFFAKEFNKNITHLWLPDVFGYSAALPQILQQCGVDVFMTQKISWNEFNEFPHHTFMWQGIDGTSILTHFLPTNDYCLNNLPQKLIESANRYAQGDISNEFLNLYGIGDGGGGPSAEHIELGLRQQNLQGSPKVKFAPAQEFFDKIKQLDQAELPTWAGELYLELHRGTYTSQAKMKRYNRMLEHKLRDVEFLGAMATWAYPGLLVERIWKDTLLNQFHDILPGSSITQVYQDAHKVSQANLDKLEELTARLLDQICPADDANGTLCWLVANTQGWERTEVICLEATKQVKSVVDAYGNTIPSARIEQGLLVQVTMPALSVISLHARQEEPHKQPTTITASKSLLENQFVKADFNEQGQLVSLFHKGLQKQMLAAPANCLQLWDDTPTNWEAWDIKHYYRQTAPKTAQLTKRQLLWANALSACIEQEFTVGQSTITQQVFLQANSALLRFDNKVNWQEERKMLRVTAPSSIFTHQAMCEIQFGLLPRPTRANTSWDKARFEMPAQRFVDLSEADCGFAVFNDCKYGWHVQDGLIDLALLRSPKNPDPTADIGNHVFSYGFYAHTKDLPHSDTWRQAHAFNSPLPVLATNLSQPFSQTLLGFNTANVKLDTIKPAQNGQGLILRMYETMGSNCKATLQLPFKVEHACYTDMLENNGEQLAVNNGQIQLSFAPFKIKTIRLVIAEELETIEFTS